MIDLTIHSQSKP
jgi:hypothetical protein